MVLNLWASVVSGQSSSKVSECSLVIKEFCGGKAGCNNRAIFIETDLKPVSEPVWPHSGIHKSMAKFYPMLCPLLYQKSSQAFDLRKSTSNHPPFSACAGLFCPFCSTFLLLPIGHFGGLRVPLSNERKERMVCLPPPMEYHIFVYYRTLLMSRLRAHSLKWTGWSLCTYMKMYTLSQLWISSSS